MNINLGGKKTVWDKHVPIIKDKTSDVVNVYLTDDIEAPANYNELCHILGSCEAGDIVRLHINTPGGHLDSAFMIIDAIANSDAQVYGRLSGTVASAGTIISMACDDIDVAPYTQFMIHNYSTGTHGKGHEVLDYIQFTDKNLKVTFKEIYGGFLTDKEIKDVIAGKDMWLETEEVKKRWAKKKGK